MFGVKMAKNLLKKAKKAVKSVKKEAKKEVKKVSSSARDHIESLAHSRRDAAVLWGMIEKGNQSVAEIKEICKEKGFDTLLGEL
jgi:DNA polymerase/3'-5' exonuclease PolX